MKVVSTGNDLPVLDLRTLSEETLEETDKADLVILEGVNEIIKNIFLSPLFYFLDSC